jgi:death on curing protein
MSIRYLSMADVLAIHAAQIDRFGGANGIRDAGLIAAALLRPQTGYYHNILQEAAAMWESLALGDGFYHGNWQVAFAATHVFLGLNGIRLTAEPADAEHFINFDLRSGSFNKDIAEIWLNTNVDEDANYIVDATAHHRRSHRF